MLRIFGVKKLLYFSIKQKPSKSAAKNWSVDEVGALRWDLVFCVLF